MTVGFANDLLQTHDLVAVVASINCSIVEMSSGQMHLNLKETVTRESARNLTGKLSGNSAEALETCRKVNKRFYLAVRRVGKLWTLFFRPNTRHSTSSVTKTQLSVV